MGLNIKVKLILLLIPLLAACFSEEAVIEGTVQDLFGRPLAAELSIEGLDTRVHSTPEGHYRLPYIPGRFSVVFRAPGHLEAHSEWHLYEAAHVKAAPTRLVPPPPSAGLWRVEARDYRPIPPARLRLETSADLGLFAAPRRSARLESEPAPWCAAWPLIASLETPAGGAPFAVWPVRRDGRLWVEGLEEARPASERLEQRALSPTVWELKPVGRGRLALELQAENAAGVPALYYVDVQDCAGEGR